jgi:hypothetical protein
MTYQYYEYNIVLKNNEIRQGIISAEDYYSALDDIICQYSNIKSILLSELDSFGSVSFSEEVINKILETY